MKGLQTQEEASIPSNRTSGSSKHVSSNYFRVDFATLNLYLDPESQSRSTDPILIWIQSGSETLVPSKENFVFLILFSILDAATKDSLKKIDRPLFKDFWERFIQSLKVSS